jgi:hypothetical protein
VTSGDSSTNHSTVWDPPAFVWVWTLAGLEVLILYILFAVESPVTPMMYELTRRPMWLVLFITMLTIGLGALLACSYQLVIKLQRKLGESR